jgi:hypothetical protein
VSDVATALPPGRTPAQQDVLDLLRAKERPRPTVDAELRHHLRRTLETGLADLAQGLDRPLFVSKAALGRIHGCEAHHLAEEAVEFAWTVPAARGSVVHKAIELSVHRRDAPPPLALVDSALDRLADEANGLGDFLLGLDEASRAELRSQANDLVAGFVELWPPLLPAWRPRTESRLRAELCGGLVVLSGRADLTLGTPDGLTAGRLIVDLTSGRAHPAHVDDLRLYALLETLRCGVPPFRLAVYSLDAGQATVEDVDEGILEVALRRTIAGTRRLLELRLGLRTAEVTPNPACRWCPARDDCDGARQWAAGADDDLADAMPG